jgi:hypothetical protein
MVHNMSAGPSSLSVLHVAAAASYDPAIQGAIYTIDYEEDCISLDSSASNIAAASSLLIEQAGRRYVTSAPLYCLSRQWAAMPPQYSLGPLDFVRIEGPDCAAGEQCPDFSASAQPLRFGFARRVEVNTGGAASIAHGIDNWKVTVWRH